MESKEGGKHKKILYNIIINTLLTAKCILFIFLRVYVFNLKNYYYFLQTEITTYGRIRGLILRDQLIVILQKKIFNETSDDWEQITASLFRNEYPRYPTIQVSCWAFLNSLY